MIEDKGQTIIKPDVLKMNGTIWRFFGNGCRYNICIYYVWFRSNFCTPCTIVFSVQVSIN